MREGLLRPECLGEVLGSHGGNRDVVRLVGLDIPLGSLDGALGDLRAEYAGEVLRVWAGGKGFRSRFEGKEKKVRIRRGKRRRGGEEERRRGEEGGKRRGGGGEERRGREEERRVKLCWVPSGRTQEGRRNAHLSDRDAQVAVAAIQLQQRAPLGPLGAAPRPAKHVLTDPAVWLTECLFHLRDADPTHKRHVHMSRHDFIGGQV